MCVSSWALDELAKITVSETLKILKEHIEASGIMIIRVSKFMFAQYFKAVLVEKKHLKIDY